MKKLISILICIAMLISVAGISAFAAEDKPFYLVFGDSIAYGSGLGNPREACYGQVVADTNGYDYANYAIPGHTTSNLINRLGEDTVVADLKKADIISISIGGNNFLMSNLFGLMFDSIVMDDHTRYDEIADNFYDEFSEIMDIINTHNDDAVVLMQTLYNPQSGYLRAPYQQGADRINAAIEKYNAENPGEIVIVDVGAALGDDMANYADDDIHPSAKGNEEIAKVILAKLYELNLGNSTEPVISTQGTDIEIPSVFTASLNIIGFVFHLISVTSDFLTSVLSL